MFRIAAAALICLAGTAAGGTRAVPVAVRTLGNGMKVLVHENHDIPDVALYLFFRVGSRNEQAGSTGLSHFLEHMMFNGSRGYGPHKFDVVMEKNGGSNNAYTTRDVTVYSDWFSRSALELILSMEAERLGHLTFDPAMVESERKVVLSERRSTVEDDNFGFLLEQLYGTLYTEHPYRWPVLGRPADIHSWTVAGLRKYFQQSYSPNNCVMVASGDLHAGRFFRLVEKDFGSLPRRPLPPPAGPAEPEQHQERRVEVERPAEAPQQLIAYHLPASANPDYWPLQVTRAILTSGRSSRLYLRLVRREQLALSVRSWQRLSLDPGELIISLDLKPRADVSKADQALEDEMERLRKSPVSRRELSAAQNRLLTDHAQGIDSNSGEADMLGTYEIFFGDYRKLFSAPQDIERVTIADVQRVAQKYFLVTNRTVATLKPLPQPRSREAAR
jgi:zinc protease